MNRFVFYHTKSVKVTSSITKQPTKNDLEGCFASHILQNITVELQMFPVLKIV